MRKIVASTISTLDGFIDDPHEWSMSYTDEQAMEHAITVTLRADALLLGRVTYEGMAQAWPNVSGNPYADHVNSIPKHVVASEPVDTTAWGPATVIPGDGLTEEVARLKGEDGGEILIWGNGRLTDALATAGLLDEYRILLHPVLKGTGVPLFRPASVTGLELVDSVAFDSGVVVLTYRPTTATGDTL